MASIFPAGAMRETGALQIGCGALRAGRHGTGPHQQLEFGVTGIAAIGRTVHGGHLPTVVWHVVLCELAAPTFELGASTGQSDRARSDEASNPRRG